MNDTRLTSSEPTNHPLMCKDDCFIDSWRQWKGLWRKAETFEELGSLLSYGLKVRADSPEEKVERICFYLNCADGHLREESFSRESRNDKHYVPTLEAQKSSAELRQLLAQKAFDELCENFFNFKPQYTDRFEWENSRDIKSDHNLHRHLFWFFRLDASGEILNLGLRVQENQKARAFLVGFCRWMWEAGRLWKGLEPKTHYLSWRPQIVRVFNALDRLDVFKKKENFLAAHLELDLPSLFTLREIAFEERRFHLDYHSERRRPHSLEEAALQGIPAAELLVLLFTAQRAKKARNKTARREQKRKKLEDQLAALS